MSADPPRFDELCEHLQSHLSILPDKPGETAKTTLVTLWHLAAGTALSVEAAADRPLPSLDSHAAQRLDELIARRLSGVPLAHLTGVQRFMDFDLIASEDALIPRPETETLVRAATEVLDQIHGTRPILVVDVCTGSGNVALAIARYDARARVFGADVSPRAVGLAARNASKLGLEHRVEFRAGDLLTPFDNDEFLNRVDLLVANPPYISTAKVGAMPPEISKFEPRLAFDGGALGISIVSRLVNEAARYLAPGGWFATEVGLGQGESTMKRLERTNAFTIVRGVPDSSGALRAVMAQAKSL